jgi:hypothetical protein
MANVQMDKGGATEKSPSAQQSGVRVEAWARGNGIPQLQGEVQ